MIRSRGVRARIRERQVPRRVLRLDSEKFGDTTPVYVSDSQILTAAPASVRLVVIHDVSTAVLKFVST